MLKEADKAAEFFAKNITKVMGDLEASLIAILGGGGKSKNLIEAATLLENREGFLAALEQSGYYDLAGQHIERYEKIMAEAKDDLIKAKIPATFTKTNVDTLKKIAIADFEAFEVIGEKAMDDLRNALFRHRVASSPFSLMVQEIKAATVGLAANGSPLSNYAKTYANTAVLKFNGDVLRELGESLGATKWRVDGPDDDLTRDECQAALSDPIRTKEEWQDAGYWGGAPGGWNCRHQLYPVWP